ncbi:hypothetical protein KQX54_007422 [Cotesia glomerata]|uniref:Uncharacterized protein n=1 Tax=Cotesia glomerata TaxID=32391 RepID=A0AAV7J603_COTGL|nr:hypothetical protein KQX54_007422 [Cotesia glomerata]
MLSAPVEFLQDQSDLEGNGHWQRTHGNRKFGLLCSIFCKKYNGENCENVEKVIIDEDNDDMDDIEVRIGSQDTHGDF